MREPHIHGFAAERADGIRVEVVRCYEGDWNVFLTRNGSVVARAVSEYRACGNGYVSRTEAFKIARSLIP